jgi:phage-related minor tail protein
MLLDIIIPELPMIPVTTTPFAATILDVVTVAPTMAARAFPTSILLVFVLLPVEIKLTIVAPVVSTLALVVSVPSGDPICPSIFRLTIKRLAVLYPERGSSISA